MKTKITILLLFAFVFMGPAAKGQLEAVFDSIYPIFYINEQLQQATDHHDTLLMGKSYAALATYFDQLADRVKMFKFAYKSRDFFRAAGDSALFFRSNDFLANHYMLEGATIKEAVAIFAESAAFYKRNNYKNLEVIPLHHLARYYAQTGDFEKSRRILERCDTLMADVKSPFRKTMHQISHAEYYLQKHEFPAALRCLALARDYNKESLPEWVHNLTLFYTGLCYQYSGEYDKAIVCFKQSAPNYKPSLLTLARDANKHLALCYESKQRYDSAYHFATLESAFKDSLSQIEYQLKATYSQLRYELEKLENEKSLSVVAQQWQETRFYGLLGLFVSVLVLSILIIIGYNLRYTSKQTIAQQREEIDRQKIKVLEQNLHTETLHAMLVGQEEERSRVSKDLHDSLGGMLSAAKYKLEALESRTPALPQTEYKTIRRMLDEACDEIRNISFNLNPYSIEKYGLLATIQDLINKLQGQNGVHIDLQQMSVGELPRGEFATHAYRIVQELVTNALKHARAKHILVQLSQINRELVVVIEDDGAGFDLEKALGEGNGLKNIHSRVKYLKGSIEWYTGAGNGTSVLIHLPLPSTERSVGQPVPPVELQYYG